VPGISTGSYLPHSVCTPTLKCLALFVPETRLASKLVKFRRDQYPGSAKYTWGVGKICDFEQLTVSINRYYEVVCALSNDDIAHD